MPEIHVTLVGRFAVTVDGVPVAEAVPKLHKAAHFATRVSLTDRSVTVTRRARWQGWFLRWPR